VAPARACAPLTRCAVSPTSLRRGLIAGGALSLVLASIYVVATPRAAIPHLSSGRYLYVFPDGGLDVYDIAKHHRLVFHLDLPQAHSMRGVAAAVSTHRLFLSVGGNGGANGNGSVVAIDLLTNHVVWQHSYPTGTDGLAVTPDGSRLYIPVGEHTMDDRWHVADARTGDVIAEIHAGPGPHNTVMSTDGRRVDLGPRNASYLYVASTRTNRIVRRVGPLLPGVRPFTIDDSRGLAYTTATGFLGFQVSSLSTGRALYTVPVHGFSATNSLGTPSHGITLTPDGRMLFVIDVPNGYVHAYDVSRLPAQPPRHVADIRLQHPLVGEETPCGGDCGRAGWLLTSLDGRYVYVGDGGDVIGTRSRSVVGFVPALRNSRYPIEIDWRNGVPSRTSTRSGTAH
jgi:DNA-binding beta-propeller fold protein YncE